MVAPQGIDLRLPLVIGAKKTLEGISQLGLEGASIVGNCLNVSL
jgi:hypothetical protein